MAWIPIWITFFVFATIIPIGVDALWNDGDKDKEKVAKVRTPLFLFVAFLLLAAMFVWFLYKIVVGGA